MLTFEQIKELIDLVSERDLHAVEVERSGFKLKIEGKSPAPVVTVAEPAVRPAVAAEVPVAAVQPKVGGETAVQEPVTGGSDEIAGAHLLKSPIVGTFYTAPSPDAEPYVQVGDRVKRGQVLCIVEAMKLMNEIESDEDGVIARIFPKNAQSVEYGEALFAIQAD